VLRIVASRIADVRKLPVAAEFALGSSQSVSIDLPVLVLPSLLDVGAIDVVSAGAIANACLFSLLRIDRFAGSARIFDSDVAEITNLNRYPLLRRSLLGEFKVALLAEFSTDSFRIEPVAARLDLKTLEWAEPLRNRVLVGVDDIPSRWLAQERCSGWLCVAGTSHFTAMVSEHTLATPCAACLHPRDDPTAPAELPTISFTSMIAGVLQAYRVLASVSGVMPAKPTLAATFNLGAERAVAPIGLVANPACPITCKAIDMAA
jgi:molybdopterin/thiamine biosynthesis adenylyltransferase